MDIFEQLAEIKAAEALEKGIEVGLQKGREEGLQESCEIFVKNLLANTEFSPEKIASLANASLDLVNKIKEGIRTK
jgi:flagellar biosynthesis/type III secretory pathway protein FliH